jgi:hypothetical protein
MAPGLHAHCQSRSAAGGRRHIQVCQPSVCSCASLGWQGGCCHSHRAASVASSQPPTLLQVVNQHKLAVMLHTVRLGVLQCTPSSTGVRGSIWYELCKAMSNVGCHFLPDSQRQQSQQPDRMGQARRCLAVWGYRRKTAKCGCCPADVLHYLQGSAAAACAGMHELTSTTPKRQAPSQLRSRISGAWHVHAPHHHACLQVGQRCAARNCRTLRSYDTHDCNTARTQRS